MSFLPPPCFKDPLYISMQHRAEEAEAKLGVLRNAIHDALGWPRGHAQNDDDLIYHLACLKEQQEDNYASALEYEARLGWVIKQFVKSTGFGSLCPDDPCRGKLSPEGRMLKDDGSGLTVEDCWNHWFDMSKKGVEDENDKN